MILDYASGAIFNDDRTHRLVLYRIWDSSKPRLMVIGLNPSSGDESKNDNTITKVIKIARNNGYGGVYMCNLFTFITPYPECIRVLDNIEENNATLLKYAEKCTVVFAWGNFGEAKVRGAAVINMFQDAYCLFKNKNGSPKHPLYCKDNSQLIKF